MELRELDGKSSISLTNLRWAKNFYGMYGVQATITAQSYGFSGTYKQLWFTKDEFAAFVQALQRFTRNHEGEARLESKWMSTESIMSPEGAVVSVRRLDTAAHVLVEAQLSSSLLHRDRNFLNSVSVAFELDPSQLSATVEALAAVLAEGEPS